MDEYLGRLAAMDAPRLFRAVSEQNQGGPAPVVPPPAGFWVTQPNEQNSSEEEVGEHGVSNLRCFREDAPVDPTLDTFLMLAFDPNEGEYREDYLYTPSVVIPSVYQSPPLPPVSDVGESGGITPPSSCDPSGSDLPRDPKICDPEFGFAGALSVTEPPPLPPGAVYYQL